MSTEIRNHAVLVRNLVKHHTENIHSKRVIDANNQSICKDCFEQPLQPKHASKATTQTHLLIKGTQ